jgi:hypothetical protein
LAPQANIFYLNYLDKIIGSTNPNPQNINIHPQNNYIQRESIIKIHEHNPKSMNKDLNKQNHVDYTNTLSGIKQEHPWCFL